MAKIKYYFMSMKDVLHIHTMLDLGKQDNVCFTSIDLLLEMKR